MVENRMQDLDFVTCGIFHIYFYNNLFNPGQSSKMQDKKRLNKNTIEILLNELFVQGNQETNEEITKQCANRPNIIAQ